MNSRKQVSIGVATLSDDERRRVGDRLRGARAAQGRERIPRAADDLSVPLTSAQERMWLLQQIEPENTAYNCSLVVRLRGPLHIPALQASLDALVARHEVFRARFAWDGEGSPTQTFLEPYPAVIERLDLSGVPERERDAHVDRSIHAQVERAFDLRTGHLLRACLIHVAHDCHVLVVVVHHAAWDGWSRALVARELETLYAHFVYGDEARLDDLPIRYRDFAVWQRQRLDGGDLDDDRRYWRETLRGAPKVLELPADFPRGARQSYTGASHHFVLPQPLVERLRELARDHGATLFMALLAGFASVLARWTGKDDLVIGAPESGRSRIETGSLVGCFINTLPLRVDLSGAPSFVELLRRVRSTSVGAYTHAELPFDRLIDAVGVERSQSFSPLVQVMFALQNAARPKLDLAGLAVDDLTVDRRASKLDVTLEAREAPEGLSCVLEYRTDLFRRDTIERLARNWRTLLSAAAANPARAVRDLPLLTLLEERQQVVEWNQTDAAVPGRCVHELIEAQAARTPDAVAVVCGTQSLTYRTLCDRADRLAARLGALGVGPDTIVGVLVNRSVDMPVALLAVLKAGGAYLPLDPSYPPERLAFMMDDSRAAVLITQSDLPHPAAPNVVEIDGDRLEIACDTAIATTCRPRPDHLAYVIYTSGSTGTPKGVMVEHRNVVNFCAAMDALLGTAPGVWLAITSISFDIAVLELWWTLSRGCRIVLQPDRVGASSTAARLIREHGVTHLQCTPTWLRMTLLDPEAAGALSGLRQLLVGGEPLPQSLLAELGHVPSREILNMYGPTETCVWSTAWPVDDRDALPPIGRPVANTRAYILDEQRQIVPVGVPGELCIGGSGVARGYLNRPDLTNERFVPDPFDDAGRIYRTGDVARYRPDGVIEYIGRIDQQVKLRGFRIELGEVEAALSRHPAVEQAVSAVKTDASGEPRLVAYILVRRGLETPGLSDVRAFLATRLPEHMLPAALVALPLLPVTPSGKVDRNALPQPEHTTVTSAADDEPRGEMESIVAATFADALGRPSVGRHQNFFELGGHSLLAAKVTARLQTALGADVSLQQIFSAPTVTALTIALERSRGRSPESGPVVPAGRGRPLATSFSQERLWILDQLDAGRAAYTVPVTLRLRGPLDIPALERALGALVRRHEPLRTIFRRIDGELRQIIQPAIGIPLHLADAQASEPRERETRARDLAEAFIRRPFVLSEGPLVRAMLVRQTSSEHLFVLALHHIVTDGSSVSILLAELGTLYDAETTGRPAALRPLDVQFADYAEWLRGHQTDEVLAPHLEYWRRQLDGAPPVLDVPSDRPRPAQPSYRGARFPLTLPAFIVERLRSTARQEQATLFMSLMAAFKLLLSRYAGRDDIIVGTPVASRTTPAVERMTGFFVNTLVLRTDCSGNPTFRSLLARVRDVSLSALAHQALPFERLVSVLNPLRSQSYSPVFQVMFAMQPDPVAGAMFPGLAAEPVPVDTGAAQFDLTVSLFERGDGTVRGSVEYATDLFDEATIARLAGHWRTLLEAVAECPDQPIDELPILTSAEHAALAEWNDTAAAFDPTATVHGLVESAAARTPDAVAIVAGAERVGYGELNARANQLARWLTRRGAGPGSLVGVCVERSVDLVVALLGVLKSGAACLPLDPGYPRERIALVLGEGQPSLVIATAATRALVGSTADVVTLEANRRSIASESASNAERPVDADDLAYVLFTSGSTGSPKGVMIAHRPVCNHIQWMQQAFPLDAADRVLSHTSIAFDVAMSELFGGLAAGATIVLADADTSGDPARLTRLVAREGVTVVDVVPRVLQAMLDEPSFGECRALRQVHCGAETLPPALVDRFSSASSASLVNFYGPTETCIDVTAWRCAPAGDVAVPIGRPMANVHVHLLDRAMRPVPIGVPGEIYVGGVALSAGYLKRPDLTAASFVTAPGHLLCCGRLYRTGDIGRYRSDGAIELLGRRDRQVKIRGVRVELDEIEATLIRQPGVTESAVIVSRGESSDARLIAYVVVDSPDETTAHRIRSGVAAVLPAPMVPDLVMVLSRLPRTATGKIDRNALPEPVVEAAVDPADRPQGDLEEIIAIAFAEVLGVPSVGRHQSFFDLGGHSLVAARLVARLREQLDLDLPLKVLFEAPTVCALAGMIASTASEAADRAPAPPPLMVSLNEGGARQPLFFLHAALVGDGFYARQLATDLGTAQPIYSLTPLGLDGASVPETVEEIAETYVREIRRVQPHGPYLLGGFCLSGAVAFEIAQQLKRAGETIALVAVIEAALHNTGALGRAAGHCCRSFARLTRLSSRASVSIFLALKRLGGATRVPVWSRPQRLLRMRVEQSYLRAIAAYVPDNADIPIAYLHTKTTPWCGGWQSVSPRVTEAIIRGDHNTCVTTHHRDTAAVLSQLIEASETRSGEELSQ